MNNYIITESCKNMRALARQALKGLWKPAIIAVVIYTLCLMVPTTIFEFMFGDVSVTEMYEETESITIGTYIGSIYSLLVTGAFTFGITAFFIDLVREKKTDIGQVFSGFSYFFKTLGLMVVIGIFTALWACLLIVPGIIAALRYSQAFYILADDPNKGIMDCIKESKEMMKGNKAKLFCLQLSFIGWYILAIFAVMILSIAAVFLAIVFPDEFATNTTTVVAMISTLVMTIAFTAALVPYIQTATTVFYEILNGNLRPASEEISPQRPENDFIAPLTSNESENNN